MNPILRTAVIGVGHLGRQHARIHAALAAEGKKLAKSIPGSSYVRDGEILIGQPAGTSALG